jgi:hypothetical protein
VKPKVASVLAVAALGAWVVVTGVGGKVPLSLIVVLAVSSVMVAAASVVIGSAEVAVGAIALLAGAHLLDRVGRPSSPAVTVVTAAALLVAWRVLVPSASGADRFRRTAAARRLHRRELVGLALGGAVTSAVALAAAEAGRGRGPLLYVVAGAVAAATIVLPATLRVRPRT